MLFENKTKKIIIIGAGVAGLSAGIFAQKHGFETIIYEKNPVAGGLCRCWKRNGYNIDGCIHWLTGTKQGSSLRALWDELGAFKDDEIISSDNFGTVDISGKKVTYWSDLDKLEKELIQISPEDERIIKKTIRYIKNFQNMHLPVETPLSLMTLKDLLGVGKDTFKYLPSYIHCQNTMRSKHARKFKSEVIREAFLRLIPNDTNLYSSLYAYGSVASGNGGVLKGGSNTLINNLVKSYVDHGGVLKLKSDVEEIIVEKDKAVGIKLTNGDRQYADYIVSANDPFNTLNLLDSSYKYLYYTKHLGDHEKYPIPSCILVTFAIDKKTLDSLNLTTNYEFLTNPFMVGNTLINSIKLRDYSFDPYFVHNNKSVVQVMLPQEDIDYSYWNNFKNKEKYNLAKSKLAIKVRNKIITQFPVLDGKIEILDVCTHKTFERYTRSYHGSFQPFMLTAKGKMLNHNGKIANIKNLILASQWGLTPGGIPIAMLSGKFALQRILNFEKLNFHITKKLRYKTYR